MQTSEVEALSDGSRANTAVHDASDKRHSSDPPSITSVQKIIAACTGSLITNVLVTPLDVVKTRLQSQTKPTQTISSISPSHCCRDGFFTSPSTSIIPSSSQITSSHTRFSCSWPMERSATLTAGAAVDWDCAVQAEVKAAELANRRQFTGTLDGVMKIAKYEGITSLWRGLAPALVMSGPSTVIYFVGYDCAKEYLDRKWGNSQAWLQWSPLLVGAVARTVAATMISPIELFRTRLQSNEGINGFRGVLDGVVEMVRREGPTSLWRGLPSTLWRDVPFSAIYWMGYETIKRHLTRWTVDNHTHRFHLNDFEIAFLSGAGSGMIAATVTTPFDVAKTRRQVDTARLTGENVESVRSSKTADILRAVVQEEGYQGLFRGLIPRVAKVAPSCAIMISSYEFGKRFFARQTEVM